MLKQRTVIHFVRHGEVDNPRSVRYGRLPGFHLCYEGRSQVEQTALSFLHRPIRHIYSSPLERTQQTATLLGLGLPYVPITLDSRLLETKTAARFEGQSRDKAFYMADSPTRDAETAKQIASRLKHFIEEKIINHNGQEIIAVSHGDPIAILHSVLVYDDYTTFRGHYPSYAAVYSFVYVGFTLVEVRYCNNDVLTPAFIFEQEGAAVL